MAKKLNPFGVTVKSLLDKGYTQIWIARKLGVKKQRVNYWAKNPVRTEQKRKRKLEEKYIKRIIELAENKPTSEMSSRRIAYIINKKLKDDGKKITIHKATICRILNKELGKHLCFSRLFFIRAWGECPALVSESEAFGYDAAQCRFNRSHDR